MSLSQQPGGRLQRGDEVVADIPFGDTIAGELVDVGPRCTVSQSNGEQVEVDEANVWRNGDGYAVRAIEHEDQ